MDPLLYNASKFVHILLAIVAVGFNVSYGIWTARAAREPQHLSHVLRGIKMLDDRVANPAYALLLVTGIVTALIGGWDFRTFWIAAAIALWIVMVVLGLGLYTPALRGQIRALEAGGPDSPEFVRLGGRARIAGIATAVPALLILALMVFKPTL